MTAEVIYAILNWFAYILEWISEKGLLRQLQMYELRLAALQKKLGGTGRKNRKAINLIHPV
jgi:hypothetical protein